MEVKFETLLYDAKEPTYGTADSAGADLYAAGLDEALPILPGETKVIHTGICVEIPKGYVGLVFARSGMATKRGLAPANKVGVIDSDYRGEIMVALYNHGCEFEHVEPGERIAQLVVVPFVHCDFKQVDELSETDRGNGGFGSTGKK